MTVGVLLLTQGNQGESLLGSAAHILGEWPEHTQAICLLGTERRGAIEANVKKALSDVTVDDGVLVLCDLFGSTQFNVTAKLCATNNACLVAGVNLAMLLEAINMRHLPIDEVLCCVESAGRDAIVKC